MGIAADNHRLSTPDSGRHVIVPDRSEMPSGGTFLQESESLRRRKAPTIRRQNAHKYPLKPRILERQL